MPPIESPKSYSLFLKHVSQNDRKAVYSDLYCAVDESKHRIKNFFDDKLWYDTYIAGRNSNTKGNIDCYEQNKGRITYVIYNK